MSRDTCILTTKDFTILEVMLDRPGSVDASLRPLLGRKVDSALVVFRDDVPPNVATLNSRVVFRVDGGESDTRILSHDRMSSPIGLYLPITTRRGLALLGMVEGQEIAVGDGEGGEERLVLEKVLYQPEAAMREKEAAEMLSAPALRRAAFRVVGGTGAAQPPARSRLPSAPGGDMDDPGPSAA